MSLQADQQNRSHLVLGAGAQDENGAQIMLLFLANLLLASNCASVFTNNVGDLASRLFQLQTSRSAHLRQIRNHTNLVATFDWNDAIVRGNYIKECSSYVILDGSPSAPELEANLESVKKVIGEKFEREAIVFKVDANGTLSCGNMVALLSDRLRQLLDERPVINFYFICRHIESANNSNAVWIMSARDNWNSTKRWRPLENGTWAASSSLRAHFESLGLSLWPGTSLSKPLRFLRLCDKRCLRNCSMTTGQQEQFLLANMDSNHSDGAVVSSSSSSSSSYLIEFCKQRQLSEYLNFKQMVISHSIEGVEFEDCSNVKESWQLDLLTCPVELLRDSPIDWLPMLLTLIPGILLIGAHLRTYAYDGQASATERQEALDCLLITFWLYLYILWASFEFELSQSDEPSSLLARGLPVIEKLLKGATRELHDTARWFVPPTNLLRPLKGTPARLICYGSASFAFLLPYLAQIFTGAKMDELNDMLPPIFVWLVVTIVAVIAIMWRNSKAAADTCAAQGRSQLTAAFHLDVAIMMSRWSSGMESRQKLVIRNLLQLCLKLFLDSRLRAPLFA